MPKIGTPGRRLAPEPPNTKEVNRVLVTLDRETDIRVRVRCLALGKKRTEYLRGLITADLDSATKHATN
jgi:hypothetical protein